MSKIFLAIFLTIPLLLLSISHVYAGYTQRTTGIGAGGLGMSDSGQYQTVSTYQNTFVSSNYGTSWTNTGVDSASGMVLMSNSGQYQYILGGFANSKRSTNYGASFTDGTFMTNYVMAMSGTGQYLTSMAWSGGTLNRSTDYGANWAEVLTGLTGSDGVIAISDSGQYQVYGNGQSGGTAGLLYYSSNYGASWTSTGVTGEWNSIKMSDSGQYVMITTHFNDKFYVSSNYGQSWTIKYSSGQQNVAGIGMNSTGQYQYMSRADSAILYRSTDYGANFTQLTNIPSTMYNIDKIEVSSDGSRVTMLTSSGDSGGKIYVSTDSGLTFHKDTTFNPVGPESLRMSTNGQYQSVSSSNCLQSCTGYVYVSTDYWDVATIPIWSTTASSTNITTTTADLNSSFNPDGNAATGWVRYSTTSPGTCNDVFGTREPASSGSSLGSGSTNASYTRSLTGLTLNTTYYWCPIASNSIGTNSTATVQSFTTLSTVIPTVTSPSKTTPTQTTVTLGANVTSDGGASVSSRGVCYALTSQDSTPGFTTPTGSTPEANVTCVVVSGTTGSFTTPSPITGLTPEAAYTYRGFARNAVGNAYSSADTFTMETYKPKSVTAVAYDAPALYSFKNTLKGSANPNGSPSRGHFRLYTSAPDCTLDTNGTRVPSSAGNDPLIGSGSASVPFSVTTTVPLVRQTNYWYCAYADNDAAGTGSPGTAAAAGYQTFTTPDGPAGGCDPATAGDLTITDACTFPATDFDGVDSGGNTNTNTARITLGVGGNVTILAGQKVARGSISFSGGLLTLQNGNGGIIRGGVYLLDADGDGYIDNNTSRYVGIAPPAGYVRRNYLATTTYSGANYDYASKMYAVNTFDCNTASQIEGVNVANLAVDADQDGYYTGATATGCVGGTSTVSGRTYYRVADGSYSKIIGNPTGGANAIAGSDCYDNTGEPCKPTINSVGSATQTSLVVTFSAGAGPSATGSALLWCDRTASGTCAPNIRIAGSVTSPYTHNATITCGKTYAYKVTSQNTSGDSDFSDVVTGNTSSCASAPSVTTSAASSVAGTTAILNSTVNPNGQSTNIVYRYGPSNVACSSLPSTLNGPNGLTGVSPLSGATTQNTVTGLTENTTYYFCASASNGIGGQQYGSVTSFTTTRTFYDLFTDTNAVALSSHTPDVGSGWTQLVTVGSAPGNTITINSNTARPGGSATSTGSIYRTNSGAADADYKVMATLTVGSSTDDYVVLAGRVQDASNMYAAEFNNTQTRLYKKVSGSWTQLGNTGAAIGTGSVVTLNMNGSNIAVLDDGVVVVEVNDSAISAAGYAGLGFGGVINGTGDTTTHALDAFEISDTPNACTSSRYVDFDNDNYGLLGSTIGCFVDGSTVATDCMDTNAQVNTAQTTYFSSNRGDGSYDYDCSTTETKDPTTNGTTTYASAIACATSSFGNQGVWPGYVTSVPACGSSGSYRRCRLGFFQSNCTGAASTLDDTSNHSTQCSWQSPASLIEDVAITMKCK